MARKSEADKSARVSKLGGPQVQTTLDVDALRQVIEILEASEVTRLSWRRGDERLFIRRGPVNPAVRVVAGPAPVSVTAMPPAVSVVAPGPVVPAVQAQTVESTAARTSPEEPKPGQMITSPFVGTFYRSPSPDQSPYVEVGTVVRKGQVLCIVEAMKLMNEIESELTGRVAEVLVENGQPVEFGQALFRIEPA